MHHFLMMEPAAVQQKCFWAQWCASVVAAQEAWSSELGWEPKQKILALGGWLQDRQLLLLLFLLLLWKVIRPSPSWCPARGDGYLAAEEFHIFDCHRSRGLGHHTQPTPGTVHVRDMGKVGSHCAFTTPCRGIIPQGLHKLAMWWSPGFLFSTPGPQAAKNLSENDSVLATSFTVWVVWAHPQILVNALSVLAPKILQIYKLCHPFLTKVKTKGTDCIFAWCQSVSWWQGLETNFAVRIQLCYPHDVILAL